MNEDLSVNQKRSALGWLELRIELGVGVRVE